MGGIVSLAEPAPIQDEEKMLSRPRPTRPRRVDDKAPALYGNMPKTPDVPPRDSSKTTAAPVATYVPSGTSPGRKPSEPMAVGRKAVRMVPTEKPPHITSQMRDKLAAARLEQKAMAAREAAKAMPIPKKSSRRRLSPSSDGSVTSPTLETDLDNWPLPNASPKDSDMRSSSDTEKSQKFHKQMTVTEPNQEEDDASIMIPRPSSNKTWEAIIEELNSDSDADSFTTASDPEAAEHGSIQIGLATSEYQVHSNREALRPPPLKTAQYKTAVESKIVPTPGPPMAVKKLGAPETLSRYASLVTLNHSREAGILFQDRRVHFTEPKVLIHITGQPARIPKVPSKDEYRALVARGMREFQEYAAKQHQSLPRVPEKSPAPKRSPAPTKPLPPPELQSSSKSHTSSKSYSPRPRFNQKIWTWSKARPSSTEPISESRPALKAKPIAKSKQIPKAKPVPKSQPVSKSKPLPKYVESKDISLKQSVKGAFGTFRKRTSKVLSFENTPGPRRRSLAVLMQPQSVRQSVEDISAQVATGRGRPLIRDSRRESRARLQKGQRISGLVASSPRTSRLFKRSSAIRNSTARLNIHNQTPSVPEIAELEGEGPYYELAAFDADGNIPRDRSLSPIRVWNNGGATWLAANKRMNETSSTLALAPGAAVGNVSRHRDWAEEYRTAIAF